MKLRFLLTVVFFLGLIAPIQRSPARVASGASLVASQDEVLAKAAGVDTAPAGPQVIAEANGLLLEWEFSAPTIIRDQDGRVQVQVTGLQPASRPGEPALPETGVLVAIPPGALPEVEIVALDEELLAIDAPLALAPAPQGVVAGFDGVVIGGDWTPVLTSDTAVADLIELEPLGRLRGIDLARLVARPVWQADGELRWARRLLVRLQFSLPSASIVTEPDLALDGPLADLLRANVVNPDDVLPARAGRTAGETLRSSTAAPALLVEVTHQGLTELTYAGLVAAGFPLAGLNPAQMSLTRGGEEAAYEWLGDNDALFENGESLLFYAEPRPSRFTITDTYVLAAPAQPGLRMSSRSAAPSGLASAAGLVEQVFEQNLYYSPECFCGRTPLGRDGDRWFWESLDLASHSSRSYTAELANMDLSRPARLSLWLAGATDLAADPDHRVQVSLNGQSLGQVTWNGKVAVQFDLDLPANLLINGANTLTLSLPGISGVSIERAWLDAFSLHFAYEAAFTASNLVFEGSQTPASYPVRLSASAGARFYDISQPLQPVRLSDISVSGDIFQVGDPPQAGRRRYLAVSPGGVLAPAGLRLRSSLPVSGQAGFSGADYVILSPTELLPAAQRLGEFRSQAGLSVLVQELQPVYDVYADGRPEPDAIRAFLSDAYAEWQNPPTYVLLLGDGSADPKRYRTKATPNLLPPYLAEVDPWAGETAADNRYVTVDGEDVLPDLLVGRIPATSLAEAQAVVDKILAYTSSATQAGWVGRVFMAADNADSAGDYPADSEYLAASVLPDTYRIERAYYDPSMTAEDAHARTLQAFNNGAGLVVYSGHASLHQWAVEVLLHYSDAEGLANSPRLPLVMEMSCFTGYFHSPDLQALDEALLRQPSGGAIAVWGPTGLGLATGHRDLGAGFLTAVFAQTPASLGAAALSGKLNLMTNNPAYADLVDTFTLFGDPALFLQIDRTDWKGTNFLPLVAEVRD